MSTAGPMSPPWGDGDQFEVAGREGLSGPAGEGFVRDAAFLDKGNDDGEAGHGPSPRSAGVARREEIDRADWAT